MKVLSLALLFTIALFSCDNNAEKTIAKAEIPDLKIMAPDSVLRHVVMFKFKESSSAEDVKLVEDAFTALESQIPEIRDYEWGKNNSPEGLNKGLTHCFLVTFHSEKDREVYLPHPAHKKFVEILSPHLEDVTVIDYWATH